MSSRSACAASTLTAAALLSAGAAHALDIDFTGNVPGQLSGQLSTATASGGVDDAGPLAMWGGSPDTTVVASGLGTAGSETSVAPHAISNTSFSPGTFLGTTGISETEWWMAGLVQTSTFANGFSSVELRNGSGGNEIGFGSSGFAGSNKWGIIGSGSLFVASDVVVGSNETTLLVLHYDATAVGMELELFVNPDLDGFEPATPNATTSRVVSQRGPLHLRSSIGLRTDNLYVGNVSPFVVPEPATAGLLALGGLALLGRRRA